MKKIWFKRKRYGFGWYPVTWEGWIVLLIWIATFIFLITKINKEGVTNLFLVFIYIAGLLAICIWKGEKPRWQWGSGGNEKNE